VNTKKTEMPKKLRLHPSDYLSALKHGSHLTTTNDNYSYGKLAIANDSFPTTKSNTRKNYRSLQHGLWEEEDLVLMCLLICEENTKKKKKNENIGFFGNFLPRVFHQIFSYSFLLLS